MKEFDYDIDYKKIDFKKQENRKFYRIGRGEQGVLLVRPYTDSICKFWRFKTPQSARKSAEKIYRMFESYKQRDDFIGMDAVADEIDDTEDMEANDDDRAKPVKKSTVMKAQQQRRKKAIKSNGKKEAYDFNEFF